MKTQIKTLVNGSQNVAGTSHKVRSEIVAKVTSENPDKMIIRFRNNQIELLANRSLSRKSVSYVGSFPESLYREMFGDFGIPATDAQCTIIVQTDMSVWITTNSKFRNSGKYGYQVINNQEVEIL